MNYVPICNETQLGLNEICLLQVHYYLSDTVQNCDLPVLAQDLFQGPKGLIYLGDYTF